MKILLTGGSGLLGQYLNEALGIEYKLLTVYNSNIGNCDKYKSIKTDITDFLNLRRLFSEINPDVVIHTAAISRPELCDQINPKVVENVNVNSVKFLAELCDLNNAKLIFTSTDLVYDGNKGSYLNENTMLNPVSFYAETKLKAENAIKETFGNFIILRTSLLFGMGMNHSLNNFHIMLKNFKMGTKTNLFYDQFRTPLSLTEAARLIKEIANTDIKSETINFGGKERVSRVELAEIVCNIGKFDKNLINSISMFESDLKYKVKDVSMNTDKLNSYGFIRNSIEESVMEILDFDT